MTDTHCPACHVLLDLPKFATGACEWCGHRLPPDQVSHARDRVALKTSARQRMHQGDDAPVGAATKASFAPRLLNFLGLGVILALVGYLAANAIRDGRLHADTTVSIVCLLALIGVSALMIIRGRLPRRPRPVR